MNPEHGDCHEKYSELLGFMGKISESQNHYQLSLRYKPAGKRHNSDPWAADDDAFVDIPEENDDDQKNQYAQAPVETFNPEPRLCIVCANNEITHSNKTCGHFCVCETCAPLLRNKCPLCNQLGSFMKIYMP